MHVYTGDFVCEEPPPIYNSRVWKTHYEEARWTGREGRSFLAVSSRKDCDCKLSGLSIVAGDSVTALLHHLKRSCLKDGFSLHQPSRLIKTFKTRQDYSARAHCTHCLSYSGSETVSYHLSITMPLNPFIGKQTITFAVVAHHDEASWTEPTLTMRLLLSDGNEIEFHAAKEARVQWASLEAECTCWRLRDADRCSTWCCLFLVSLSI